MILWIKKIRLNSVFNYYYYFNNAVGNSSFSGLIANPSGITPTEIGTKLTTIVDESDKKLTYIKNYLASSTWSASGAIEPNIYSDFIKRRQLSYRLYLSDNNGYLSLGAQNENNSEYKLVNEKTYFQNEVSPLKSESRKSYDIGKKSRKTKFNGADLNSYNGSFDLIEDTSITYDGTTNNKTISFKKFQNFYSNLKLMPTDSFPFMRMHKAARDSDYLGNETYTEFDTINFMKKNIDEVLNSPFKKNLKVPKYSKTSQATGADLISNYSIQEFNIPTTKNATLMLRLLKEDAVFADTGLPATMNGGEPVGQKEQLSLNQGVIDNYWLSYQKEDIAIPLKNSDYLLFGIDLQKFEAAHFVSGAAWPDNTNNWYIIKSPYTEQDVAMFDGYKVKTNWLVNVDGFAANRTIYQFRNVVRYLTLYTGFVVYPDTSLMTSTNNTLKIDFKLPANFSGSYSFKCGLYTSTLTKDQISAFATNKSFTNVSGNLYLEFTGLTNTTLRSYAKQGFVIFPTLNPTPLSNYDFAGALNKTNNLAALFSKLAITNTDTINKLIINAYKDSVDLSYYYRPIKNYSFSLINKNGSSANIAYLIMGLLCMPIKSLTSNI